MVVTFRCCQCDRTSRAAFEGRPLACSHCGAIVPSSVDRAVDGELDRCLICPSTELFVRKDFPQALGLAIIILGFVLSSVALAWHHNVWSLAILIATAAIDGLLYSWMGAVLTCYRCHAEYRGVADMANHPAFKLEVHERHRRQAARLAESEPGAAHSSMPR